MTVTETAGVTVTVSPRSVYENLTWYVPTTRSAYSVPSSPTSTAVTALLSPSVTVLPLLYVTENVQFALNVSQPSVSVTGDTLAMFAFRRTGRYSSTPPTVNSPVTAVMLLSVGVNCHCNAFVPATSRGGVSLHSGTSAVPMFHSHLPAISPIRPLSAVAVFLKFLKKYP